MGGVANRVALVTGAGSETGIGFAIAKLLKGAGAQVAITSTREKGKSILPKVIQDADE